MKERGEKSVVTVCDVEKFLLKIESFMVCYLMRRRNLLTKFEIR